MPRASGTRELGDANTLLTLLQGCNSMLRLRKIHAQVLLNGLRDHALLSSKLLYFCAVSTAGDISYARLLFAHHIAPHPTAQDWNSMIRAHSLAPDPSPSFSLYNAMNGGSHPSPPDHHTFSFLLKACARARAFRKCREAHSSIVRSGFSSDIAVRTNLALCYAENSCIDAAKQVFDETPFEERDLVCWNSMITCYCRAGLYSEAMRAFEQMMAPGGVGLDEFTAVAILSSCAHAGALAFGARVRKIAEEKGFLARNLFVANALIDMYIKCGHLDGARQVFDSIPRHDVLSWNSMIRGLGIHGRGKEAIYFFHLMLKSGVRPNSVTFLSLLLGCSHQGLVEEGLRWFRAMASGEFGAVKADKKHYGCVVDMLGRAGRLEEALEIIESARHHCPECGDDPVLWRSLLNASKLHGNVKVGKVAVGKLIVSSRENKCSLRTAKNLNVRGTREMVKTAPGWSWIEANCGDFQHVSSIMAASTREST